MSFNAKSFVFDGTPSETYDLSISNLNSGEEFSTGSSSVDLLTQNIFRRSTPYFYGVTTGGVLSFPCAITRRDEITAEESRIISAWLFGRLEYKKLQVVQSDMLNVYYNCFLNNPQLLKVGNKIHGYSFDVVCDAPWAWEFPKTLTKTYTGTVSDTFTFDNTSDDSDYLYPSLVVTINGSGGAVNITNTTDASRLFQVTALSAAEVLTVDNSRGIMTSSTGLIRLSLFNKNWFRFVPGRNSLTVAGEFSSLVFTYQLARKVV